MPRLKSFFSVLGGLLGILIMIVGVIISPLPGPMGLPVFVFGLIVTLRSSRFAKRFFMKLTQKFPKTVGPIRKMLRPKAPIIRIIYHIMLKVERKLFPFAMRVLKKIRRLFRQKKKPKKLLRLNAGLS